MVRLVKRIEGVVPCYAVDADTYEEAEEVALEMYARECASYEETENETVADALTDFLLEALAELTM